MLGARPRSCGRELGEDDMNRLGKMLAAGAALAMLAVAPAEAACWNAADYSAAQLRELDTMLMVQALRCRNGQDNYLADYNRFVETGRLVLTGANMRLRNHFVAELGARQGPDALDRYITSVANRYGAGTEGLSCADMASIARAAVTAAGSAEALFQLAAAADMAPMVPGERCAGEPMTSGVTVAARR